MCAREMRGHRHIDALVLPAFDVEKRIPAKHQDRETDQGNGDPQSRVVGNDDAPNENHSGYTADHERCKQGARRLEPCDHELN
jgi:hypothetical protein